MQPVGLWFDWLQATPFTQMLIEPGLVVAFGQAAGCASVVYSPTTWHQRAAWKSPQVGCQSAAEPSPAVGLKT
jgi:hypothetical protein